MDRYNFRIAEKLAALFTGVASEEDRKQVEEWKHEDVRHVELSEKLSNPADFEENQQQINSFPVDRAWKKIEKHLDNNAWKRIGIREVWKYVAVVVVLVGVGVLYFSQERSLQVETTAIAVQTLPSGRQGAKLTLGNGKVVEVTPENQFVLSEIDGTMIRKDSIGIDYTQVVSEKDTLVFNEMQTLTGMEYTLALSDGTKVYLNAESRLRFPVAFRGKQRVVELNGEAYFKVAKDAAHPFIVKMDGVELKVLGTSFNARSYPNEEAVVTTLVEGKVEVNGRRIVPGEQALYMRGNGKLSVQQVDTEQYIAWHQGCFIFRNERLEDIMKTLARWYGVEYHFVDQEAKNIRIGARFERYDNMEPIINMLRRTKLVNVLQTNHSLYISGRE